MGYRVDYSTESILQLDRLDKQLAKRIIIKIESSANDPHLFFKRLTGRPEYKLRVGDYRVIVDINDSTKAILVRTVGHRKNIYEKI